MADIFLNDIRTFQKTDTCAQWKVNNPVLGNGEIGFETDTFRMKIGNGSTAWTDLPYTNYTEITGIELTYNTPTPHTLAQIPEGFFLNTISVEIVEPFQSNVQISIGTDSNQSWIFSPDTIDLTDEGFIYVYKVNEVVSAPTELKAFFSGTRTQGKLMINIK